MKKILTLGALFTLLASCVFYVVPADAAIRDAILGPGSETNVLLTNLSGDVTTIKSPGQVVFGVIQVILGFLGIIGVIMMMYAGFLWLTASGEEEKAKKGRTLLFQAVIGTLIVLSAYTVTYFILRELAKAVT